MTSWFWRSARPQKVKISGLTCGRGVRAGEARREGREDEDRYNRFDAGLALRRLDSEEAKELLIDALFTARWCPVTTAESRY